MTEETPKTPVPHKRHQNRRRMAWIALLSMIAITMWLLGGTVDVAVIGAVKEVLFGFYFAMTSVVGAYMGFTTAHSIWSKDKN